MSQAQRQEITVNGYELECLIKSNRPAAQVQIDELRKIDFHRQVIQFYELLENGQKQNMAIIGTQQEFEEWIKAYTELHTTSTPEGQSSNPSPKTVAHLQKNAGIITNHTESTKHE